MQDKPSAVLGVPRGGTGGIWRVDLTGQTASIGTTDLVAAGSVTGGLYVVKGILRVTTAAGTSSSVSVRVRYTEAEIGTSIANTVEGLLESVAGIAISPLNNTGTGGTFFFTKTINAAVGTAIQYSTTYASNPAAAMAHSLHLICSRF